MITHFVDATTGASVYVNPDYVVMLRPDPAEPDAVSVMKISDGETVRVRGGHNDVASRLTRPAA